MRETWYVLEDGNVADPNECTVNEKGYLVHESGIAVAMRGEVPSSRGVDIEDGVPVGINREVKPEKPAKTPKGAKAGTYKTREAGAE